MESVVRSIDVGMAVVLGGASIELKDYMKLGVGDVMILDRKVGEPLRVLAGDAGEFTGQPGRIGNKIAVRILERLDSETSS
jgi:flagellar motor switch protein FliM